MRTLVEITAMAEAMRDGVRAHERAHHRVQDPEDIPAVCLYDMAERTLAELDNRGGPAVSAASAALQVERLAEELFTYRTSSNIPLPADFWRRQTSSMRQPFLDEAAALLAALRRPRREAPL